jgi:hypothetical protein
MRNFLVFHPFIIGLFPVLSFLSGNSAEMEYIDAVKIAVPALLLVFIALCICQMWLKDMLRSSIIASGLMIFTFSPVHVFLGVQSMLSSLYGREVELSITPVFVVWTMAFGAYAYFFSKKASGCAQINSILNILAISLVSIPLAQIALHRYSQKIDWKSILEEQRAESLISTSGSSRSLPDIYYIIMDRYAGSETLRRSYHFDNSEFLSYLGKKGFYVAAHSSANYPSTTQSMAASLNLQHLQHLQRFVAPGANSWLPIQRLLQDHKVRQFLHSKGYRYIHMGSWWEPTRKNKFADENVNAVPLPENFYLLHDTTMLKPISDALGIMDLRYEHWRSTREQFQNLTTKVEANGPKFVLAHFLLPHEPYVFSPNGKYVTFDEAGKRTVEANYIDQVVYANRMLQKTIDQLLAKSRQPPIIVVQGDEGPWPLRYLNDYRSFDWAQATDAEVNQKMRILNSFYLPGMDSRGLYAKISPVNTFRVIFNLYFGTNLLLLKDESYIFARQHHPYNLVNITSRLGHD